MNNQTTRPSTLIGAAAGLSAGIFGLGVAEATVRTSERFESPVVAVGDRFIDVVPPWLKDLAISLFGTNDKIALLVGIGSLIALFAAFLGIRVARGDLKFPLLGVVLFVIVGSLASTFTRTGTDVLGAVPTLVGGAGVAAALVLFWSLLSPKQAVADAPDGGELEVSNASTTGRRPLVGAIAASVGLGLFGFRFGRSGGQSTVGSATRGQITLPAPVTTLPPIPATTQAAGAASFITPNADFYRIDTALVAPQVDASAWSLRIHGMVDEERVFTFDELAQREVVESDITLTCVSNTIGGRLLGNARWTGIRLDDLLADIGLDPAADQIVGRSVDGYTCGFPVSALDGRDALVAFGMNGELLPIEHGFPARLIVPGLYGYVSATKWLSEIEITTFDAFDHFWVPRGYAVEAPIKIQSRIDSPRGLDQIDAGPFAIGGVAWAQPVGIEAVEISIDDSEWIEVELADELTGSTWRQWSYEWDATPGRHSISVRATNKDGEVQTDERAEPLPNGASGHHTVVVLVSDE